MNKAVIYILSAVCALCIIISLAFTAMEAVIFNEERFHSSYEKNDLYEFIGVDKEDLHEITHEMMQYLHGRRDDLIMHAEIRGEDQQVFGEREIAHMVDVKKLFMGGFATRNIAAVLAAALLVILYLSFKNKIFLPLCRSYLWVMAAFLAVALFFGVYMIVDFDTLFLKFHLMFFDNDLWLLDIDTDVLIQMLPESFFNSLALAMVGYLSAFILVPAAGSVACLAVNKKKNG